MSEESPHPKSLDAPQKKEALPSSRPQKQLRAAADIAHPRREKVAQPSEKEQKKQDKRAEKLKKRAEKLREKTNQKQQREQEKKEMQSKITKKWPSKEHWKYFPVILSAWEKRAVLAATILVFVGIILAIIGITRTFLVPIPDKGGTYVEGVLGQPNLVNPILLKNDSDRDLAQLLYSGLLRYDANQELTPDLATNYEISEDGRIYTFTLRENATWHDGIPVTAADVVFTVQLIQDSEVGSPRLADFQGVTVKQDGDYTVQFELTKENFTPFLRENTTFGILPKHLWEDIPPAQIKLNELNLQAVGSGPFMFKEFRKDNDSGLVDSYTVERYKNYYGQVAYLDEIIFRYYADPVGAAASAEELGQDTASERLFKDFTKQKIDGIHALSPAQIADLPEKKLDKWQIHTLRLPSYFALFINQTRNEALEDLNVRKALGQSLDRERIVSDALNNAAEVTDAPILPDFLGFNPEINRLQHNDEEAKALLEEAGWTIPEGEQFRKKNDTELVIEVVMPNHDPFPTIGSIIKDEWEAIGVRVDIATLDFTQLRSERIRPREYQMLLFGQSVAHDPDPYPFWHSSLREDPGLNLTSYKNPDVDELLESARKDTDEESRTKKYLHFQNELADDLPAIFLYIPTYTYALSADVQGVQPEAITFPSDRLSDAHLWYKEVKWRIKPQEESTE